MPFGMLNQKLYDDYYLTEIKIPFNQLYFINGQKMEIQHVQK